MLTIIFYGTLFVAILSIVFAIIVSYHFYWLAAVAIYTFSLIGGFSIGQATVALVFIPIVMGIGHALKRVNTNLEALVYLGFGCILTSLVLFFKMGNYLFYAVVWLF